MSDFGNFPLEADDICTSAVFFMIGVLASGSVYYVWRGCKADSSPADGCTSDIFYENCRETCDEGDLCNGADLSVTTTPPPSSVETSTTSPATTTTGQFPQCVGAHIRSIAC